MKRILIFSLNYFPYVGGAEVAIKEITDLIADTEFHLICYRFNADSPACERIGNVIVHRVGVGKKGMTVEGTFRRIAYLGKIFYVPLAALKAFMLHREGRFDGAWAMMIYMTFPLVLLRMIGVCIPYVLTLQEGDPFERQFYRLRIRLFAPLLYYGIRHTSHVQAISAYLLGWARRAGYSGEGSVIPNGVAIEHFTQAFPEDDVAYVARELGKKPGDTFLVTTSRLVHKNGIDTVIDALPHLSDGVKFVIAGSGPLRDALKARVEMHKLTGRVIFLGEVSQSEMPLLLAACDIFIRPSRSEGLGISFIEAMAAGLPVIATQEGGLSDFLFDRSRNPDRKPTGYAVTPDAPQEVADRVQEILEHPEQAKEVVENARALVGEGYDWTAIAPRMRSILLSI
jgi:glycosyltransferase involved in cell wall biosynthesis